MNTATLKILFILALFSYPFFGFTQWVQLDANIGNKTLNKVYTLSEDTVFIVGDSIILKTVNGGEFWDIQTPPYILETITFVDNNVGYIAGRNVILKTEDRGENWFPVSPPDSDNESYRSLSFISQDTGFVISLNAIYKTSDGGTSWTIINIPYKGSRYFNSLFFSSDDIGYLVGRKISIAGISHGFIFKTIDGGENWEKITGNASSSGEQSIFEDVSIWKVFFIDNFNGWIGCYCCTNNFIVDCPYRNLFKTSDGGETWDTITTPFNHVIDIYFANENIGYISSKNFIDSINCYNYDPYNIHKTNNGGLTWEQQTFLENENVLSIHCANPDVCYAVGTNSLILKTINGGANINVQRKSEIEIRAYPNPFSNSTTISFSINKTSQVKIYITNSYGQEVLQLHNKYTAPGNYEINIDGNTLQPGVYFCVMETKAGREVIKIVKM